MQAAGTTEHDACPWSALFGDDNAMTANLRLQASPQFTRPLPSPVMIAGYISLLGPAQAG
jgi:hypothetical protein